LTEAGVALLEDAKWILARAEQAIRNVQRATRGELGTLCVGFTPAASFSSFVPETLRAFQKKFPEVAVTLRENDSDVLFHALLEGGIDAAFTRPPSSDDRIALDPLFDENMIAALPLGHVLAKSPSVPLSALSGEPFVFYPRRIAPNLYDVMLAACQKAGFTPEIVQEAPQISSTINLVAAGIGVSIVPAPMQQIHKQGVVFRPLRGNPIRAALCLAYRRGELAVPVRNFIKLTQTAAAKKHRSSRLKARRPAGAPPRSR
jgi:DNA-binding transcriptional LysR family regulator